MTLDKAYNTRGKSFTVCHPGQMWHSHKIDSKKTICWVLCRVLDKSLSSAETALSKKKEWERSSDSMCLSFAECLLGGSRQILFLSSAWPLGKYNYCRVYLFCREFFALHMANSLFAECRTRQTAGFRRWLHQKVKPNLAQIAVILVLDKLKHRGVRRRNKSWKKERDTSYVQ